MNKYSIILPVRNGGSYARECVSSVLAQTLDNFNLIVLDNNSTDGTPEWIISLKDPRIILHRSAEDLTIEENWARIKDVPKNEFITLIGHDDLLHPFYLQEMEALITRHPGASLYQAHFSYIDVGGRFIRHCLPMDEVQHAHEFLAFHIARTLDSMGTGYMMRSADYDGAGGIPVHYPNLIFADYELWITLMQKGYKATCLRHCFSYRLNQSLSKTTNGMLYQDAFGKYIAFISRLMRQDPLVHEVIKTYGKEMLLYYCEALSHRLLKTPWQQRSLKVKEFIRLCDSYAYDLIPEQDFNPMRNRRIRIAAGLDQTLLGRQAFYLYKKLV